MPNLGFITTTFTFAAGVLFGAGMVGISLILEQSGMTLLELGGALFRMITT